MSSVDDIVDVQNTITDVAPTRPSFGLPLFVGYHTVWVDKFTKLYGGIDEMTTDGFTPDDYLYLVAQAAFEQEPAPPQIMIGRRAAPLTQTIELVPTNTTAGAIYAGTIGGQSYTYTNGGAETVATLCAALTALIDPFTKVSATNGTTKITVVVTTPGAPVDFSPGSWLAITDVTADTTTDDTYAAIDNELDGQDTTYYGAVVCDSHSKATALLHAAHTEAAKKLGVSQTADAGCGDPSSTTDTMYALQAASYTRTGVFFHGMIGGTEWLAVAALAGRLTVDPGAETWAFKTATGVTFDVLQSAFKAAIDAKNGNIYVKSHGTPIIWEGKAASGRYLDSTRFIDWQTSTIDYDVFAALDGVPKQPFTNKGLSTIGLTIEQSIQKGVVASGVDGVDVPPVVTYSKLADTAASDRAQRIGKGFAYAYRLTGALHSVQVRGTITV